MSQAGQGDSLFAVGDEDIRSKGDIVASKFISTKSYLVKPGVPESRMSSTSNGDGVGEKGMGPEPANWRRKAMSRASRSGANADGPVELWCDRVSSPKTRLKDPFEGRVECLRWSKRIQLSGSSAAKEVTAPVCSRRVLGNRKYRSSSEAGKLSLKSM